MIDHKREGYLHIVTLNDGANMVTPAWQTRFIEILDAVEADSYGNAGLVLTGTEKFFCSGLNVEVVMSLEGDARARFSQSMMKLMHKLIRLPVPTVAAINGHAFAAGAFLALACDYRIMREDRGWFCISEVDVGVPIGEAMMSLLKGKVSPQTARESVLSGKRYVADEAIAAGLADEKASEGELLGRAQTLAGELATKERKIFSTLKHQLYADVAKGFSSTT